MSESNDSGLIGLSVIQQLLDTILRIPRKARALLVSAVLEILEAPDALGVADSALDVDG